MTRLELRASTVEDSCEIAASKLFDIVVEALERRRDRVLDLLK